MKDFVAGIFTFFRDDFFPNLGYYLLQIFLVVLWVLIFAGVNIMVRFVTDPICIKVLRMKEHKRGPGLVGLVIALVLMAFLLAFAYSTFPQLRPTVIGWTGHKVQQLIHWGDKLPDLAVPPAEVPKTVPLKTPTPEAIPKPSPNATPKPILAPAGAP